MKVNLDRNSSGFCFGVQSTINVAEEKLRKEKGLYSLGDVVHNEVEVKRLEALGLITIDTPAFNELKNAPVLIRAHGEPPSTYETANRNNLTLTDTTCPVVAKLQRTASQLNELGYQIIIYGKHLHPEVIGINGHCQNRALIIKHADLSDPEETLPIDLSKKTALISQTTMDVSGFYELKKNLEKLFSKGGRETGPWAEVKSIGEAEPMPEFIFKDTICRQISNRNQKLQDFSRANERIIFVAGKKSSNGQVLYAICKEANPESHFIEDVEELQSEWFTTTQGKTVESIGVCGATSTPMWLLEKVANHIEAHYA
ncbi:MAG TPA: 4-hydroxy-3-methylbut-2-enyl diphosphate reductase [Chlorobium sp.]|uniref:4-hydroxy-3-methylbut-2-enyl diphosphate reductase n=1 Tax=Chlorobium phaeovibrioides (strain DSM 265 / 1930) TaxID=290318 RepID=ISPH_CHLPM|nr:RecName: Full=4-hydroxy-3-methylbut-2-enyl diphosphate reductase; Short=HMBPP reductase [Chlorobium phaeovibrioides DSM 265]HCD35972.1 4-hydroxy-3-methylbut-2-enyl diphosphate reductase [Chlorobium sp.]